MAAPAFVKGRTPSSTVGKSRFNLDLFDRKKG